MVVNNRVRRTQKRKTRRRKLSKKRMRGGCIPCAPLAPLVGLGGLAGATFISRSSNITQKNGKIKSESETRVMKHNSGKTMSIRVYEKNGVLKATVGTKSFKRKPGETRNQLLQRAIKHCEKRGYKGCSGRESNRTKKKKSKN